MKKKTTYLLSILLCMFFLASCNEKSTDNILNSTLDKLNSIENIDQSLNLSCNIENASPIKAKINSKSIPKESKFYSDFSMDIMPMKLNLTVNSNQEKTLIKFNNLFPKYIDIDASKEGKEFLKSNSESNLFNFSSKYNSIFKMAFDEAKKNNIKLVKAKKSINGSEQTLNELSLTINSDELNNLLKSSAKDFINKSESNITNNSYVANSLDSLKISDIAMDTYINDDYVPIYTELKFKINVEDKVSDCNIEMIINSYDSKIEIPEVKESEIATPDEIKNLPLLNIK